MPELPEVETILQGIRPHVKGQVVQSIVIRQPQLRWKIPATVKKDLVAQRIIDVTRRGKFLLFETKVGTALLHLGMSGSIKLLNQKIPPNKHDHFDIIFADFYLRYNDPRRFGAFLWSDLTQIHPLLATLGPEPLSKDFNAHYLYQFSRNRKITIKQLMMNGKVVVGIGNIYAAEALFLAHINPLTLANELTLTHYQLLVNSIKKVLNAAIVKGGTTLKDFSNWEGKPGYFKQQLNVYGREGESCYICKQKLQNIRIQNRSTIFCPNCQPAL